MSFNAADEAIFRAYQGDVDAHAMAYLEVHYRRYQATLAFLEAAMGQRPTKADEDRAGESPAPPVRILELGAIGPYLFTLMLARRFPQAEIVLASGSPPSPLRRLDLPSKNPGFPDYSFALHTFNAEKDVWPFDAGSFDLILSMEMLEHMLLDPCFLFREAHRVLARDGHLVVTTPNVASREGVGLMLRNDAPYRFGPYSPYGEYGRHNREYVPRELARLGEACGLATGQLTTQDVYPVYGDMAAIERLLDNSGDPSLRGQNIFYDGVNDGRPFTPYPDGLFDYQPPEYAAILRVRRSDRAAGEIRLSVEVTNTGLHEWRPNTGNAAGSAAGDAAADATWLGIRWLDRQHHAMRPEGRIPLPGALRPGDTAVLEFTLPDPDVAQGFCLKLDMFHEGTGWFHAHGGKNDFGMEHCPTRMDRSILLEFAPLLPGSRARRRILIATTQVPFVRGGAEMHAEGLLRALLANGCEAEIATIPFKWYPPERLLDAMLACRLLDLTEYSGTRIDLLIGLKFPAYLIPHPRKVLWILHQHRAAYDLWGQPLGDLHHFPTGVQVREAIVQADRKLIPEARAVFANSRNVARRLRLYCGLESRPLYHPPPRAESFYCAAAEDFLFFPSRLNRSKRQELVLEALALTRQPVVVAFAGAADEAAYAEQLQALARNRGVEERVRWLGNISEEEKIAHYARSLGVIYPPVDEDYGYVSLEAMLSAKPLITCTDSGGPLEFVEPGATGLVAEPLAVALAEALDRLWANRAEARSMGQAARERYAGMRISWETVLEALLGE
jgi:glycosyltransferase involved in cell wall biosynthesis/SAM-dependent methyltransferase